MLTVILSPLAKKHIQHWQKTDLKKIHELIDGIKINPTEGIGKPERLKYMGCNVWARRIDNEHRLVYKVQDNAILIASAKYHYEK